MRNKLESKKVRGKILQLYLTEDERTRIHSFINQLKIKTGKNLKASNYFRKLIFEHIEKVEKEGFKNV